MSLSEHRFEDYDYWSYKEKDVKEFIMILKTKWCGCNLTKKCAFCRYIDKLAGDELI